MREVNAIDLIKLEKQLLETEIAIMNEFIHRFGVGIITERYHDTLAKLANAEDRLAEAIKKVNVQEINK